mmetsp:Transcript_9643/g.18807  ORF Transcript_9643/g.18807 Transcript_9643/m.18807 type:complete len:203 (-) Transcript_9643:34-642(-)
MKMPLLTRSSLIKLCTSPYIEFFYPLILPHVLVLTHTSQLVDPAFLQVVLALAFDIGVVVVFRLVRVLEDVLRDHSDHVLPVVLVLSVTIYHSSKLSVVRLCLAGAALSEFEFVFKSLNLIFKLSELGMGRRLGLCFLRFGLEFFSELSELLVEHDLLPPFMLQFRCKQICFSLKPYRLRLHKQGIIAYDGAVGLSALVPRI